jgi:hypothetical protein
VTKLDDALIGRISDAIKGGSPMEGAAAYAGVRRSTLYEWLRDGRADPPDPLCRKFVDAVEQAIGTFVVGASMTLTRLGNEGDSRALMFMLERRFPDEFGRRQVVEHGNANGEPFKVQAIPLFDPDLLTLDELRELERLLVKGRPADLPVVEA